MHWNNLRPYKQKTMYHSRASHASIGVYPVFYTFISSCNVCIFQTLKTAKVNNNHQHPSSTKILLLHPSHPIKSLEAEELFLPSINCQARTNNNNKNNKSNHCQCLTLETITINNKNNNNRVPREEIISTPIHQDGILLILTVLVSMLIKNKLPDSQYSAPCLSRSI